MPNFVNSRHLVRKLKRRILRHAYIHVDPKANFSSSIEGIRIANENAVHFCCCCKFVGITAAKPNRQSTVTCNEVHQLATPKRTHITYSNVNKNKPHQVTTDVAILAQSD
jgi:hypothetical protein